MELELGKGRKTRRVYGFDEIALVPSLSTVETDEVDISVTIAGVKLELPIIASAMDSVIDPNTAALMSSCGGMGVLNIQGIQTRYEDADNVLDRIALAPREEYVPLMQKIYLEEVKPELITKRIKQIKDRKAVAAVSVTPQKAMEYGHIAEKAGADILVVQATVVSTLHKTKLFKPLDLSELCKSVRIPVIVGNCVTYEVALKLMETGVSAVLVGIGPGAACTSRGVLGIGIPMATAIVDCACARDDFYKKTKKYVSIIADGGMVVGGDICKSIACGADAVMIGSPLAKSKEAPGKGFHWGMATPNSVLPRGTRIKVGTIGSLKEILLGPAKFDDGSENFVGALKTSMGTLGASNIKEMQSVDIVIAPSNLTEGKVFQKAQQLGMYK
ncbi:MAG: GuaB3 family IMP dehydrogenase-related protein [Candidatus Saganbacteria bacterium]|nr:GuaB3 family IMP dehydrogenase-related protein [Candidatus Saganbacteria bacterium]